MRGAKGGETAKRPFPCRREDLFSSFEELIRAPRSCLVKRYNQGHAGRQPALVQPNPLLRNTHIKFCSLLLLPHVPGAALSLLGSRSYSSSQALQAWAPKSHTSYKRLNPFWLRAPGPNPGPVIWQSTLVDNGDSALYKTGRGRGSE